MAEETMVQTPRMSNRQKIILQQTIRDYYTNPDAYDDEQVGQLAMIAQEAGVPFNPRTSMGRVVKNFGFNLADTALFGLIPDEWGPTALTQTERVAGTVGSIGGMLVPGAVGATLGGRAFGVAKNALLKAASSTGAVAPLAEGATALARAKNAVERAISSDAARKAIAGIMGNETAVRAAHRAMQFGGATAAIDFFEDPTGAPGRFAGGAMMGGVFGAAVEPLIASKLPSMSRFFGGDAGNQYQAIAKEFKDIQPQIQARLNAAVKQVAAEQRTREAAGVVDAMTQGEAVAGQPGKEGFIISSDAAVKRQELVKQAAVNASTTEAIETAKLMDKARSATGEAMKRGGGIHQQGYPVGESRSGETMPLVPKGTPLNEEAPPMSFQEQRGTRATEEALNTPMPGVGVKGVGNIPQAILEGKAPIPKVAAVATTEAKSALSAYMKTLKGATTEQEALEAIGALQKLQGGKFTANQVKAIIAKIRSKKLNIPAKRQESLLKILRLKVEPETSPTLGELVGRAEMNEPDIGEFI